MVLVNIFHTKNISLSLFIVIPLIQRVWRMQIYNRNAQYWHSVILIRENTPIINISSIIMPEVEIYKRKNMFFSWSMTWPIA